jgi:hypothetical protein
MAHFQTDSKAIAMNADGISAIPAESGREIQGGITGPSPAIADGRIRRPRKIQSKGRSTKGGTIIS